VTRLHSLKKVLIDVVKLRNPFKQGNPFKNKKNKAILEYNDWIIMYCKNSGLCVLDLEQAVRYSAKNRYLREDLAKIDGLHINRKAYKILDKIVLPTLETVNWEIKAANELR
jgi:lysophospholipase L1-like esterase